MHFFFDTSQVTNSTAAFAWYFINKAILKSEKRTTASEQEVAEREQTRLQLLEQYRAGLLSQEDFEEKVKEL